LQPKAHYTKYYFPTNTNRKPVETLIATSAAPNQCPTKWWSGCFCLGLTTSGTFTVKSMYLDLLDDDTKFLKKYIWKRKVPLKIKVFMWFLHRKVILRKDNLIKRNCNGHESCCFCDHKESIRNIFSEWPLTKIIWRIIHMTFGLAPPKNITNIFGNWLKRISKNDLIQIRVGVCAIIWAIWNTRNDWVFNKLNFFFLAGYPIISHWIHMWSFLQQEEQREAMDSGCNCMDCMETVVRDLFNRCDWS
jgi:hypothetical protein